ncbi:MAG: serine/threonine-protein kinase [Kofleriaceae bacterium]
MENSSARSQVEVGSIIGETYIIEALIGRGGMGAVYLARHKDLEAKQVAIKTLHAELSGDEIFARFKREAEIASKLKHPNIVGVENIGKLPDGTPYIVYEYLEGESLAQRIHASGGGPMNMESVFSILRQVGSALSAAHRAGIIHRDLKPANIFLVPSEVEGRAIEIAKVLDFGISKILGSTTVKTQDGSLFGTPQYMAPEQATGKHDTIDERTDLFALGTILYEMVSGKSAFVGESIPEVVFKVVYEPAPSLTEIAPVPPVIASAIEKAMAKKPEDRYKNVAELVEAITGAPLSVIRKPRVSNAAMNSEAMANTIGSGDYGVSPMPGTTLDAPPPLKTGAMTAPEANASTQMAASVPPVVAPPVVAAPPASNKGRWLIAAALGVIAIGGVALYLARSGPKPVDEPPPQKPIAAISIDAAAQVIAIDATQVVAVIPIDAAPPLDAKPPVKKVTPAVVPPAVVPPKADAEDEHPDASVAKLVAEAEAAYHAGDYKKTEQLANLIITNDSAGPKQRARGHQLHGFALCSPLHNERANSDLRAMDGFPVMQGRLRNVCKNAGLEMAP